MREISPELDYGGLQLAVAVLAAAAAVAEAVGRDVGDDSDKDADFGDGGGDAMFGLHYCDTLSWPQCSMVIPDPHPLAVALSDSAAGCDWMAVVEQGLRRCRRHRKRCN